MSIFPQSELQEVAFQHAGQRAIAEIEAKRKNAPAEAALIVPDDPFAGWPSSEDQSWKESAGKSSPGFQTARTKKKTVPNSTHYPAAKTILNGLHPGLYATVEQEKTTYGGMVYKQDLWGFADLLGVEELSGRVIACNVTTTGQMVSHLRHWTDPSNTHGQSQTPVLSLLRRFLECRGVLYIIGFDQPGGPKTRWVHQIRPVTMDVLEAAIARKKVRR